MPSHAASSHARFSFSSSINEKKEYNKNFVYGGEGPCNRWHKPEIWKAAEKWYIVRKFVSGLIPEINLGPGILAPLRAKETAI